MNTKSIKDFLSAMIDNPAIMELMSKDLIVKIEALGSETSEEAFGGILELFVKEYDQKILPGLEKKGNELASKIGSALDALRRDTGALAEDVENIKSEEERAKEILAEVDKDLAAARAELKTLEK